MKTSKQIVLGTVVAATALGGSLTAGILSAGGGQSASPSVRPTSAQAVSPVAGGSTSSTSSSSSSDATGSDEGVAVGGMASSTPATAEAGGSGRPVEHTAEPAGSSAEQPADAPETPRTAADGPPEISGFELQGSVPDGLDVTAFPSSSHGGSTGTAAAGNGSFRGGPGCAYQCIVSGVAHRHGSGADLVVATSVPADLYLAVVADLDDDGVQDTVGWWVSDGRVTHQSWFLDDLDPAETYYAMVTATDEHGDISYAWGSFALGVQGG